ncbi:hypothetical protein BGP_6233 [Beggiatoa sp. PS]|nr:hypothetical protein BGP_6233 [Beggiatoa sp. PS]
MHRDATRGGPRVGLRIHSSPQELIGSNSWSGD